MAFQTNAVNLYHFESLKIEVISSFEKDLCLGSLSNILVWVFIFMFSVCKGNTCKYLFPYLIHV